jgi:anti-sigma factor RsiW
MENEKDNSAMRADDPEFLLSQYLDGQLEPAEMERLEGRLGNDLALRREMQRYAKLDEMLDEMRSPRELDSVDFDSQRLEIMAALERKSLLKVRPRFNVIRMTFAGVGALAAAAIIAVGTWVALRTPPPGMGNPIVRVELVQPDAPRGQVVVAIVAPEKLDPDTVVVVEEPITPKELAQFHQSENQGNIPDGTVLMFGASPEPADEPANNMADLLLE